jgi:hypothetical protein
LDLPRTRPPVSARADRVECLQRRLVAIHLGRDVDGAEADAQRLAIGGPPRAVRIDVRWEWNLDGRIAVPPRDEAASEHRERLAGRDHLRGAAAQLLERRQWFRWRAR